MPTTRLTMRQLRDILRLKFTLRRSHREIARSLSISPGSVGNAVSRAKRANLSWDDIQQLDDTQLESRLYGTASPQQRGRPLPDFHHIHREKRRPGVTLELLHVEYLEKHPDGYRYTRFCRLYKDWRLKQKRSMRHLHRAGEKLFIDFSGKRPHFIDTRTRLPVFCELFVAVLGASNYTFATAIPSQSAQHFVAAHVRAFTFFGGLPALLVPDQLKAAVTRADRYEADIHRTYNDMARHYGVAVLPARQRKPKDKAKVEVAVQIVQRWILARLRNETFFSLATLNESIAELLDDLNARVMKTYGRSRRQLFEELERPALRPLPFEPFTFAHWKIATVHIDYHVQLERHAYSVPHALVGQRVEMRFTDTIVEIFHNGGRVAAHPRRNTPGHHSTLLEHMPRSHRAHREWSPSRLLDWAGTIGPQTAQLVEQILASRPHPEQGYRSCLGLMRLTKRYEVERVEAACARAVAVGALSYRHVASILKNGLDRLEPLEQPESAPLPEHENLRGPDYYH